MGFTYRQFSKGIYFDGHEREDVVKDHEKYVATMASVEDQLLTPSPAAPGAVTPIIRVFHARFILMLTSHSTGLMGQIRH